VRKRREERDENWGDEREGRKKDGKVGFFSFSHVCVMNVHLVLTHVLRHSIPSRNFGKGERLYAFCSTPTSSTAPRFSLFHTIPTSHCHRSAQAGKAGEAALGITGRVPGSRPARHVFCPGHAGDERGAGQGPFLNPPTDPQSLLHPSLLLSLSFCVFHPVFYRAPPRSPKRPK
jgi:hypothetical protein